jgi:parvulin-like peptidyl-prolyl isomerase
MVMRALRTGTKPVLWILIAAFVGTIIFAWGMEFTRRPTARGIVGSVDGVDLRMEDYNMIYENALSQQQQKGDVTEEQAAGIRDQVFDQMVGAQILRKVIDKLGLEVTNAELAEHLRRFPPQEIRTLEYFQTDGKFDYNKYLQAFQNPDRQLWLQIESLVRPRLLQSKLYEYVTATTVVDDAEVKELYEAAGEKLKVRYILAPSFALTDSVPAPDSQTVRAYYNNHTEEFRHKERAKMRFIQFDKKASAEDSAEVQREAQDISKRARAGEDFSSLVKQYSEDNSSADGDLGWFKKGQMVKPFEDAAFALDSGQVSDPVTSRFGIHIIKCDGHRGIGDSAQVKAFHILLKVDPSSGTLSDIRLKAQQFAEDLKSSPLDTLAKSLSVIPRATPYFEKGAEIPFLGKAPAVSQWAFSAKPGDISEVFDLASGMVVAVLDEIQGEAIAPFAEVKSRITTKLRGDAAKDYAVSLLSRVRPQLLAGASMADVAKSMGRTVDSTATAFGRFDQVPGAIGDDPSFRGAAFALARTGDAVSPAVKVNRGAVIMQITEHSPADPQKFVEKRDSIMTAAFEGQKQLDFNDWYAKLRAATDVQDFRYQIPGEN